MDTKHFLLDQLRKNWQLFGQAIDDLKESFDRCGQSESSLEEWALALEDLDEDFITVQEHFEMLTAIDNLYRIYKENIKTKGDAP